MTIPSICHFNLPVPIKALVDTEFLTGQPRPQGTEKYSECLLLALSCYTGHYPTFKILILSTGAIFEYVGLDVLYWKPPIIQNQQIESRIKLLCPVVCPSNTQVALVEPPEYFKGKTFKVFFIQQGKNYGFLSAHELLFIVDWMEDNENLNFMKLDNGQFAFVPNHKLVMLTDNKPINEVVLPCYVKNRKIYKP
jgi:hypothetical protein